MAKYQHAYVIPDGAKIKGGNLYDRWGNLSFFADVSGLEDKALTAEDKETIVKGHQRRRFMNADGKSSVTSTMRYWTSGLRQTKGALPGVNLTLESGDELRTFTYDGNISGFVDWLKDNAKVDIQMFGPKGTPYDPIPKKEGGG